MSATKVMLNLFWDASGVLYTEFLTEGLTLNSDSSPPGGATAYQLLQHSINCQVANMFAKNDANLALSPTFRYVSIESPL
ncbi:hypothetical protein TNCV_3955741 [Trichonephila clavipes]|nr:hypothetical protein TNCV_3955741 [Trichonephila clavipes]